MIRPYRWRLLEYQHQEQSPAYSLYHWANEPDLRRRLREATRLEEELRQIPTQWGQILRLMDWVHHLSHHQGWNEAPDLSGLGLLRGAQEGSVTFRCVEFAHMLQQVLAAFAFPARVIGLRRPGADEGLGKAHVVVDVWSTEHGKWVVLDPQLNLFYAARDGAVLSALEIHDRVRSRAFHDLRMSRDADIRQDYTPMESHDTVDYETMEVPDGFDRDEVWRSLPDHGDVDSFIRFWEEYYDQFVFRRSYSLNRPKSVTGNDSCRELYFYDVDVLPPIVFQRMAQAVTFTTDRSKIAVPINGVELQWAPAVSADGASEIARGIELSLRHSMPWFDHYEVALNAHRWTTEEAVIHVSLQPGENTISVQPINDYGRPGEQAVVRLWIN
ncbi:transglutaminase domain-containing protein [Sulfobacillus harzensis]|uniref:Transglutaminase domain-containing protein n=1 Tax=Sulfobacillus harzensis TaxID=2729629 RepID=A0A7Y0L781_9FIRM|nr:transglutaminase domain-containing protein [Sulfobacillus harzensis]NMP23715.1 transglutaminase domain-containing protein [Sulfobacillus harzensis]